MPPLNAKRHAKYYFEDGNVVFLTSDGTLFRLHKFILKYHSTFFNDMFDHNPPTSKDKDGKDIPIDGGSDENPICLGGHPLATLHDVELEAICKVLYDMPGVSLSKLDLDELIALFFASRKFQFETIYQTTVELLDIASIPPWRRYALAMHSLSDTWLLRSCMDICSLVEYPPVELSAEFSRLNALQTLTDLLRIREWYRTNLMEYAHDNCCCPTGVDHRVTGSIACTSCRAVLKTMLKQILTGNDAAGRADANTLPLLKDRMLKGIQNSTNVCNKCRAKGEAVVTQVLGLVGLERGIKEVASRVSL